MKEPKHNPALKAAYLEVVENQLRNDEPQETHQTLVRLMGMGYNEQDSKILIASAVAAETSWILKNGEAFNHERFIRYLRQLPNQDFDEE